MTQTITSEEVAKHNTAESTWITIKGKVYDVTKFLSEHPGGEEVLLEQAGRDATVPFYDVGHSSDAVEMLKEYFVGDLPEGEKPVVAAPSASPAKPGASLKDIFLSPTWTNFLIPTAIGCLVFVLYKTAVKIMS